MPWWLWRSLSDDDFQDESTEFNTGSTWQSTPSPFLGAPPQYSVVRNKTHATTEAQKEFEGKMQLIGLVLLADIVLFGGLYTVATTAAGAAVATVGGLGVAGVAGLATVDAERKNSKAAKEEQKRQQELNQRLSSSVWQVGVDNQFARATCLGHQLVVPSGFLQNREICQQCELLLDAKARTRSLAEGHIINARSRCPLCRFILDRMTTLSVTGPVVKRDSFIQLQDGTRLAHLLSDPRAPVEDAHIQVGIPLPQIAKGYGVVKSGLFQLCKAWLHDCDREHDCMRRETGFSPKRLIDTGRPGDSNGGLILVERACPEYVVLSHSWGARRLTNDEKDRYYTNSGNIQARLSGFHLDDLPQSFQDAVTVTRALGKRYLWIDSVCLIQNKYNTHDPRDNDLSNLDLSQGLATMQDVFASAYCTIAATSAKDSKQGFLRRYEAPQVIKVRNGTGALYVSGDMADFDADVSRSRLNSRAWVLQERVLSRRTLHFSTNQIYWECGKLVRSDSFCALGSAPGRDHFIQDAHFPAVLRSAGVARVVDFLQWLFTEYAGRGITVDNDRYAAISGLTARMETVFGKGAKYGVLDFCLARMLLWRRADGLMGPRIDYSKRTDGAAVPSWSWMAYEGRISFVKEALTIATHNDLRIDDDDRRLRVNVRELKNCVSPGGGGSRGYEVIERDSLSKVGTFWPDEAHDRVWEGCVVVGYAKGLKLSSNPLLHVIFVRRIGNGQSEFVRLGLGQVRANCVYGHGERGSILI